MTATWTLVARLDSAGDVFLAGPALRAGTSHLTLLVDPRGRETAHLPPGCEVRELVAASPWETS
ncbi:hypothetical protein [Candidatus Protofrankia californiensis]|uniref:hypothetical protein n=1 Tax=Candidatus Protofrankia californiensis TaxID=1839754 RepID=UPI001041ADB6|nr:hypothetical protein [Candidatus Protofrankia californiensis]